MPPPLWVLLLVVGLGAATVVWLALRFGPVLVFPTATGVERLLVYSLLTVAGGLAQTLVALLVVWGYLLWRTSR